MGYSGPPWDALGTGALTRSEENEESERAVLDAPAQVTDHVRRTR